MYICKDCESTFDKPDTYRENVGEYWGTPAYQTFGCCPYCKSGEYEEMKRCKSCGEYHVEDGDYCDQCLSDVKGIVESAISNIQEALNTDRDTAIDIMYQVI